MQFLLFIIAYPFLLLISILPFRIFYWFSDIVYFIVYYIIGYRKKVVRENMALALPHLSEAERKKIEKKFYQHMCDMFLEMIKTKTISAKEMNKRFNITNIETVKEYEDKGKSVILLASHYASYEWVLTLNCKTKFKGVGVYKKIRNKYFDKFVRDIRTKYGTEMVETKKAVALMAQNAKYHSGDIYAYGLVSDQTPALQRTSHWDTFMGVEVPVHIGAETLARRYDLSMIFVKVEKVKRGFYQATFIPVCDHPREIEEFKITHDYLRDVEKQILETPEYYLWTHKRWKHQR